jgi:hypothetical protein
MRLLKFSGSPAIVFYRDNREPSSKSSNIPASSLHGQESVQREHEPASPARNITTLNLQDERGGEIALSFKSPAREALVASANRLLRFEFPPVRDARTYERLIKTNVISAGLSKKKLETLPLPDCEKIYRSLWSHALEAQAQPEDDLLNLMILLEEMAEFVPEQWMAEDIRLLGVREPGKVPCFYYEDGLNRVQLAQFLSLHGYRNDFLLNTADIPISLQYLACRRLTCPVPWSALLQSLDDDEAQKFNRLNRLKALQKALHGEAWYRQLRQAGVTTSNLSKILQRLQEFLCSETMRDIALQCGIPAPVRTLVLVEGETERLLLPLFAKAAGYDFCALGIEICPAGGKNYMPTLYRDVSRYLKAGICVVLDGDADAIAEELQPELRPSDALFQIEEGEFEDIYDLSWVLQIINRVYQPYPEVTAEGFQQFSEQAQTQTQLPVQRVQTLKAIWQAHNLGSFDKIAFAQQYAELFSSSRPPRLPDSMNRLLEVILRVRSTIGE